jgi:hypothetical protein
LVFNRVNRYLWPDLREFRLFSISSWSDEVADDDDRHGSDPELDMEDLKRLDRFVLNIIKQKFSAKLF